jgi:putative N6-adenine-specific DNA methylase
MSSFTLACPCLFGLESVLAGELRRMGAQDVHASDGRVSFSGDEAIVARANIRLRTAERVLIVLGSFYAQTFDELFEGVRALPFEQFLSAADAFPVKGGSLSSQLKSIPDCQAIIKKAAAKRLGSAYGRQWLEESGPVHQIQFSILKNEVTVMLDTSGPGLYKRGYRLEANLAPMKETLAAGLADLARVREDTLLFDPMCGSGTILIESALKALRIPPGLKRTFSAQRWGAISQSVWKSEREEAFSLVRRDANFRAFGRDIDPVAVQLTQNNAARAGVGGRVRCDAGEFAKFEIPKEPFVLIVNPPYGERMLDVRQARQLYQLMGKLFEPGDGRNYYIISPDDQFEELFGRTAKKRRKLYNGMLSCQLYMYF